MKPMEIPTSTVTGNWASEYVCGVTVAIVPKAPAGYVVEVLSGADCFTPDEHPCATFEEARVIARQKMIEAVKQAQGEANNLVIEAQRWLHAMGE